MFDDAPLSGGAFDQPGIDAIDGDELDEKCDSFSAYVRHDASLDAFASARRPSFR
jgi:hypothetical protein